MSDDFKHYGEKDAIKVLSRDAILNLINSNRNYGKTWLFKYRAVKRYMKRRKKTLWLRVFKEEAQQCASAFFQSGDLEKKCGLKYWDKKTQTGNYKISGSTIYLKRGTKYGFEPAIIVGALCEKRRLRGFDDVRIDTIILDEYQVTPSQLRRYVGNMVEDFNDIFISIKREHEVRVFLLGNKESRNNPFLSYFGIKQVPESFEGIRMYKDGTILLQQINNRQRQSAYESRVEKMFAGTAYGAYLYDGQAKGAGVAKLKKAPPTAFLYVQVEWDGYLFRIYSQDGFYYVMNGVDKTRPIFTNGDSSKWVKGRRLVNRSKALFKALIDAIQNGRVYFNTQAIYEAVASFIEWLGAVK